MVKAASSTPIRGYSTICVACGARCTCREGSPTSSRRLPISRPETGGCCTRRRWRRSGAGPTSCAGATRTGPHHPARVRPDDRGLRAPAPRDGRCARRHAVPPRCRPIRAWRTPSSTTTTPSPRLAEPCLQCHTVERATIRRVQRTQSVLRAPTLRPSPARHATRLPRLPHAHPRLRPRRDQPGGPRGHRQRGHPERAGDRELPPVPHVRAVVRPVRHVSPVASRTGRPSRLRDHPSARRRRAFRPSVLAASARQGTQGAGSPALEEQRSATAEMALPNRWKPRRSPVSQSRGQALVALRGRTSTARRLPKGRRASPIARDAADLTPHAAPHDRDASIRSSRRWRAAPSASAPPRRRLALASLARAASWLNVRVRGR